MRHIEPNEAHRATNGDNTISLGLVKLQPIDVAIGILHVLQEFLHVLSQVDFPQAILRPETPGIVHI